MCALTSPTPSTAICRAAAILAVVLAVLLLRIALVAGELPTYARVMVLAACVITPLTAHLLHRRTSQAARLLAIATALLMVAGTVLVGAVGLPGAEPTGLTGTASAVVGLALVVTLLLALDGSPSSPGPHRPPYAL